MEALRLAFRLGQRLEGLLLDRAEKLAAPHTAPGQRTVITPPDVIAAAATCLPDGLRLELGVPPDGPKSEQRSA